MSENSKTLSILFLLLAALLSIQICQAQKTFRNPIFENVTAPQQGSILKHLGYYYMTYSTPRGIELLESLQLSSFRNAERRTIYTPPAELNVTEIYHTRIYRIQGDLYIYFTMSTTSSPQQIFAIKCLDPAQPMDGWSLEVPLLSEINQRRAFLPAVMEYGRDEALYLIWGSSESESGEENRHLYIAKMEDPLNLAENSTAHLLRSPSALDWEEGTNEAPFVLQRNAQRTFLVFSVRSFQSGRYCLGIMGIDCGGDPMLHSDWWNDVERCVMEGNEAEGVVGPGRATFVQSPGKMIIFCYFVGIFVIICMHFLDEREWWMVYSAMTNVTSGQRDTFIQKVEWEMDSPVFPKPVGRSTDLEVPSGE